ncbi:hypothetical protein K8R66_05150 [bacterium]|nr:hypothetical protein [bacterium]
MENDKIIEEQDILKQTVNTDQERDIKPSKNRISILGIIFTIIMAIILVVLGERILFDLNKTINPSVEKIQGANATKQLSGSSRVSMGSSLYSEKSILSQNTVYYKRDQQNKYLNYKILIHAGFIIPIFLLSFLSFYFINLKKKNSNLRVVSYGYLMFSIWMIVHLLIELIKLAYREFPGFALYLLLILLAVIFTMGAIFIQKNIAKQD